MESYYDHPTSTLAKHYLRVTDKIEKHQIKNIDFIYMINLDRRPDKLQRSLAELSPYGIEPHRVSGIYGWDISQAMFNDIGMKILPHMRFYRPVNFKVCGVYESRDFITASSVGKTCVHHFTTGGQLGCILSHISVLADAYEAGYETIWVLEDDFTVVDSPYLLSDYIDELDKVAKDWGILYTDDDHHVTPDTVHDILNGGKDPYPGGDLIRPGISMHQYNFEPKIINEHFLKIGGRCHCHSMVIRRSAMKKILDFLTPNGIFRASDMEYSFIPGIDKYNLRRDLVHGRDRTISDTGYKLK
ncbi:MAG: glycosyltransferase family 25 protein [Verrucomicrobia bacterium]|nr:glycosyltransferase family 25 protein [Verrucomicrobiota bacterium]